MKKLIISGVVAASLIVNSGLAVFAQTKNYNSSKSNTAVTEVKEAVKNAATDRRGAVKEAITEKREAVKSAVGEKREAVKNAVTERKDAVKTAAGEKREAVKNAVTEKRDAVKAAQTEFKANLEKEREVFKQRVEVARDEFKQKRKTQKEELKARLEKVKDERKKQTVERLDNRFTEINTKQTNHLLNTLTRLEELLGKVSSRADKAESNGQDVSAVRTAIEKAKIAIASARTALEAQLAKTYPIQGVDSPEEQFTEARLKSVVAMAREALNKDLKAAKEVVRTAHKAIVEATKSLRGVPKVDEEPATTTQTPVTEPAPTTGSAPVTQ